MSSRLFRNLLIVLCTILAMPGVGLAQEAAFGGTVIDTTGSVLPGVTVKAVHGATGNVFETVTDARGVPAPCACWYLSDRDRAAGV